MSSQFYEYLSNKLLEYFKKNSLSGGDRFLINFDKPNQVQNFYEVLKKHATSSFEYQYDDNYESYNTYSINFNGVDLIVATSKVTPDFLVKLRNLVSSNDENFNKKALLIISDSKKDSLNSGMVLFDNEGYPFSISAIKNDLEEDINNSKLSKIDKTILEVYLDNIIENNLYDFDLWDLTPVLSAIISGKIEKGDYPKFDLFFDSKLQSFNDKNRKVLKNRIKQNNELYMEIENEYKDQSLYGKFLKNNFDSKGINLLKNDNWESTDYFELIKSQEKVNKSKNIKLADDYLDIKEDVEYWEKSEGYTTAKMRKKHIIIFNKDGLDEISLSFKFTNSLERKFIKTHLDDSSISKNRLNIKVDLSSKDVVIKSFKYKHENLTKNEYVFNVLIVNTDPKNLESIKDNFLIKENGGNKKNKIILLAEDEFIEIGCGEKIKELSLKEDDNIRLFYDERLKADISQSFYDLENSELNFDVSLNSVNLSFLLKDEAKRQTLLNSRGVWEHKLKNKETFIFDGKNLKNDYAKFNIKKDFKYYLNLENQIIGEEILFGKIEHDSIIKEDIIISPELKRAYSSLFEYFQKNNTLPSLTYLDDELKGIYSNILDIFNREVEGIGEDFILNSDSSKSNLNNIGGLTDKDKFLYSPISPLNLAYQLKIADNYNEVSPEISKRLEPNKLLPYIYDEQDRLFQPIQDDFKEWIVYENTDNVSIGTTNLFLKNVVEEKLKQFVSHFSYLFKENFKAPIKINVIGIEEDKELVKGIFNFIRDRLPDKRKTGGVIPVEVNIYNKTGKTSFEEFFKCDSPEDLENFGIKINNTEIDSLDIIRLVQENINYYLTDINESAEYEYSHISFYKPENYSSISNTQMDELETGLSLNGLLSSYASTLIQDSYRTGFGLNHSNTKDNLVKLSTNLNELAFNNRNRGINPYRKGESIVTVSWDNKNIEDIYNKSRWVTFIEPNFGLDYFNKEDDISIIHYSDQYSSSTQYDTITVSNKIDQYKHIIKEFLSKYLDDYDLNKYDNYFNEIIGFFNSINGDWLLNLDSLTEGNGHKNLSVISAIKYVLSIFNHEGIVWIPISMGEILRIAKNMGFNEYPLFSNKNLTDKNLGDTNDILLMGFSPKTLEVFYYPIKVEIGNNITKHSMNQIANAADSLKEFLFSDSSFKQKFYRNFFIQLFISNQQKLIFNNSFSEKSFDDIIKYKRELLNDEYMVSDRLNSIIGKGACISFNEDIAYHKLEKDDDLTIIELPIHNGYEGIVRSINDIEKDFREGNMDIDINELLCNHPIESWPKNSLKYKAKIENITNPYVPVECIFITPNEYDEELFENYIQLIKNHNPEHVIVVPGGKSVAIAEEYYDNIKDEFESVFYPLTYDDESSRDDLVMQLVKNSKFDKVVKINHEDSSILGSDDGSGSSSSGEGVEVPSGENNDEPDYEHDNVIIHLGRNNKFQKNIYWEFGNPDLENRHMLIQGASGQGKTYFIQKILQQLSHNNIPSIIIDYTNGFKKKELDDNFKRDLDDKIKTIMVITDKIALNPFKKYNIELDEGIVHTQDNEEVANRFKSIIGSVYPNLGVQQLSTVYDACFNGLEKFGDDMDLIRFKEELEKIDSPNSKTALSQLKEFLDKNPFNFSHDFDWSILDGSNDEIHIIQLTGLSRDIQKVISEFLLWDLWYYKQQNGSKDNPFFVVLDEAQNLDFSAESPCGKILTEGRKYGWAACFATQSVKNIFKKDEISRLNNVGEKIFFKPPDNEISNVAATLANYSFNKNHWKDELSNLTKGNCIVKGLRVEKDVILNSPIKIEIDKIN